MSYNPLEYISNREKAAAVRAVAAVVAECNDISLKKGLASYHLVHLESAIKDLKERLIRIEVLKELKP